MLPPDDDLPLLLSLISLVAVKSLGFLVDL
jgi:hypothetical protein